VSTRNRALLAGALLFIVGALFAVDALIVTDEEKVREFAEAVSSPVDDSYFSTLERWIDLGACTLEVVVRGQSRLYTGDDIETLRRDARRGLSFLQGSEIRTLSRSLEIEADQAALQLRLFTSQGVREASFRMRRNDESWVVERVHVM